MKRQIDLCACGRPLHYTDDDLRDAIQTFVDELGETMPVRVIPDQVYLVPRHYIALHGIKAQELPELAKKYGWKKVE